MIKLPIVAQALIVLIVASAVSLIGLGTHPYRSTEGFRVEVARSMIEAGDWRVSEVYELDYARKPLGVAWAIGASFKVFGESEFAARLPSALAFIAMALVTFFVTTRWIGAPWGLSAGLAQVLMPAYWAPARAAEIESLLFLGTQLGAFAIVALMLRPGGSLGRSWGWVMMGSVGMALALAVKGPASAIVWLACLVACFVIARSSPKRLLPIAIMGVLGVVLALPALPRGDVSQGPVETQGVSDFLFDFSYLDDAPLALLLGMPLTLAVLFPWGPDARREPDQDSRRLAAVMALAWFFSIVAHWLVGVWNPRYTLGALVLLPPIVAYVVRAFATDALLPKRWLIARVMTFGHPVAMAIALCCGAVAWVVVAESSRASTSSQPAAVVLAQHLSEGDLVWIDQQVDSRPELGLYLEQLAGARVVWAKELLGAGGLPAVGSYLVLRESEHEALMKHHPDRLVEVYRATARHYDDKPDAMAILVRVGE
ncbi:MAG: phospholipid carrier-dependent glycosyltransferase [Planctomycetota bacterium]